MIPENYLNLISNSKLNNQAADGYFTNRLKSYSFLEWSSFIYVVEKGRERLELDFFDNLLDEAEKNIMNNDLTKTTFKVRDLLITAKNRTSQVWAKQFN